MSINQEFRERFARLTLAEKQRALADVLSALTIASRASYDAPETIRFERMRHVNETSHVVSNKLRALLVNNTKQYPDDVFLDILFEKAGPVLASELQRAFDWALAVHKQQAN